MNVKEGERSEESAPPGHTDNELPASAAWRRECRKDMTRRPKVHPVLQVPGAAAHVEGIRAYRSASTRRILHS